MEFYEVGTVGINGTTPPEYLPYAHVDDSGSLM